MRRRVDLRLQRKNQSYSRLHITQRFSRQTADLLGQPLLIQRDEM